jgi:hypothetical protein
MPPRVYLSAFDMLSYTGALTITSHTAHSMIACMTMHAIMLRAVCENAVSRTLRCHDGISGLRMTHRDSPSGRRVLFCRPERITPAAAPPCVSTPPSTAPAAAAAAKSLLLPR